MIKQERNDICLCGSGKKYKKCCGHTKTTAEMELEIFVNRNLSQCKDNKLECGHTITKKYYEDNIKYILEMRDMMIVKTGEPFCKNGENRMVVSLGNKFIKCQTCECEYDINLKKIIGRIWFAGNSSNNPTICHQIVKPDDLLDYLTYSNFYTAVTKGVKALDPKTIAYLCNLDNVIFNKKLDLHVISKFDTEKGYNVIMCHVVSECMACKHLDGAEHVSLDVFYKSLLGEDDKQS